MTKDNYILALDVSTSTIGIALFEDMGTSGKLKLLVHVSPVVKPKLENKMEELFKKVEIFDEEFLVKYTNIGIKRVIIEEPLLQSNNVYTIATLLRFNGMISKLVYDKLNIVPDFISSYDARKYAFPELMEVRKFKKDGTALTEKQIANGSPVLFGGYPFKIDKKLILWEKVSELEPQIEWIYDKTFKINKKSFDMSDAYVAGIGFMNKIDCWKK
jgi:hypothetical protein